MKVVLGLGTNVGNRLENLRAAIRLLRLEAPASGIEVLQVSPLYESEALLPDQAPSSWNLPFLNLALLCETELAPFELLSVLKRTETRLGRIGSDRWAPRVIDLDILLAEDFSFQQQGLNIPHVGLLERPFALLPANDLVPNWTIPVGSQGAKRSLAELSTQWLRRPRKEVPYQTHRTTLSLAQCIGTLNVTPDSFSDGGKFLSPQAAITQGIHLIAEGAEILDIGAQSTRPGSQTISEAEEWNRLEPVLTGILDYRAGLAQSFLVSLDTYHANTAARAIELGVNWINDQSGCDDAKMIDVLSRSQTDVVIMHHLDLPENRARQIPSESDPVALILAWGKARIQKLVAAGIPRSRIIFDPGIGFGTSPEQTWDIFRRLSEFQALGTRLMVGHSRKSFLSSITKLPPAERDLETTSISPHLVKNGADYLRVHQSEFCRRSLAVWTQLDGVVHYRK